MIVTAPRMSSGGCRRTFLALSPGDDSPWPTKGHTCGFRGSLGKDRLARRIIHVPPADRAQGQSPSLRGVEAMTYGPADLYVVEFARSSVPAAVTSILRDAATAGVITLLDVALVRTLEDGPSELVELNEFSDEFELAGLRPPAT